MHKLCLLISGMKTTEVKLCPPPCITSGGKWYLYIVTAEYSCMLGKRPTTELYPRSEINFDHWFQVESARFLHCWLISILWRRHFETMQMSLSHGTWVTCPASRCSIKCYVLETLVFVCSDQGERRAQMVQEGFLESGGWAWSRT
jgi:hypothetical protein